MWHFSRDSDHYHEYSTLQPPSWDHYFIASLKEEKLRDHINSVKRFEREVKSYAEPITGEVLRVGEVYFSIQYADRRLLHPTLRPFVFLGRNLTDGDVHQFYFQDLSSYSKGIRLGFATEGDLAEFQVSSLENLQHIFEFEHALDSLISCALSRQKAGIK